MESRKLSTFLHDVVKRGTNFITFYLQIIKNVRYEFILCYNSFEIGSSYPISNSMLFNVKLR